MASSASWASPEGQGLAITPSCGCNWFSSLSLPPSLSVCFSLLFPALSVPPAAQPSLPPPARGSWGHSTLAPSLLLAWSCLLSRCLPQEVGIQLAPSLLPNTTQREGNALASGPTGEGLGARTRVHRQA